MQTQRIAVWAAVGMAMTMLAGCRVEKSTHGDGKEVNISTPFGGMHVKTNTDVLTGIGLPGYPGAQAVNDDGDDNRTADVNMSFGHFQLRVKKAQFRTDDPPEKVEAFYRDGMKRYGVVIACRDDHAAGGPVQTSDGLTCDDGHKGHVTLDDHSGNNRLNLKAGSKQHQHIVEIEPDGDGTKFGLVALDLPGKMTVDDETGQGTE